MAASLRFQLAIRGIAVVTGCGTSESVHQIYGGNICLANQMESQETGSRKNRVIGLASGGGLP